VSTALPLGTRFLLFLYGTPNIVGSALALAGLGLYFGGVIDDWWLAIVAGLYAVGWLATPRDRSLESDLREQAAHASLLEQIDALIARSRKRLPAEAFERLKAIRAILASLMPKLQGLADTGTIAMDQMITVVNAVTRDLPSTIANYVRLPEAFATLHHIEHGKTAKQLLIEQLDLLREQLGKIADSAFREDAEALVVNGKYLKEKFHSTEFLRAGS
jgi:hypothetical protein